MLVAAIGNLRSLELLPMLINVIQGIVVLGDGDCIFGRKIQNLLLLTFAIVKEMPLLFVPTDSLLIMRQYGDLDGGKILAGIFPNVGLAGIVPLPTTCGIGNGVRLMNVDGDDAASENGK